MKRCPQCNSVETDEALKFCRVDGATLVSDSSSLGDEAGTAQLAPDASEVHTSILPHNTNANINRVTAATTVLPPQPALSATRELSKPKRRPIVVTGLVVAVIVLAMIIGAFFYLSRNHNNASQSIAVLPFENRSGNSDTDYLSDGLADSLIYRLSHMSLGMYDWQWDEAGREFKRAIELDDKNALAHLRIGICYYLATGRASEGVRETLRAVELEPLDLVNNSNLVWMYVGAGRKNEALAQARKVAELEPDFVLGRYQLGLAYLANGMYQEAIALTEKPLRSDPNDQLMLQIAGYAYARFGRHADANAVILRFREIAKTQYVVSYFIATTYAGLGEREKAFAELENGYQQHNWRMTALLKKDPLIDSLRDDARYRDLLKRMNLPE